MKETWKAIKGYEGLYEVSSDGRIRSLKRSDKGYGRAGIELKPLAIKDGYKGNPETAVTLYDETHYPRQYLIKKIVWCTFVEGCGMSDFYRRIYRRNKDIFDNRAENLYVSEKVKK